MLKSRFAGARDASSRTVARIAPALALATLFVAAGRAGAQQQVGSFVSGERPLYMEITPFIEGQSFHVELRNLPPNPRAPFLFVSGGENPIDMAPANIPGFLGPDLANFILIPMDQVAFTLDGVIPTGLLGYPLYLQAYVKGDTGGRLSSMVTCHVIQAADDPGVDPTIKYPLPLYTQELRPPTVSGVDRTQQPVRVGLPLPIGEVTESLGVPLLTVTGGTSAAQFSTLATWPDGSVKWALCEYLVDLAADATSTAFSVDKGTGNFGGNDLATISGTVITVDTGAATIKFDSATSNLFDSFVRGGREVFDVTKGNAPRYVDDQDVEWTWHETAVALRRNGPVRAEVEIDGMFTRTTSSTDPDRVLARFYVEAFKGGTSARVMASLRATSIQFPEHILFRGFSWRAWLNETGAMDVRMPITSSDGLPPGLWTGNLASTSDDASIYQGFARTKKIELCYDPNWSNYVPFIERYSDDDFAIEGVRARIGATYFTGTSSTGWWTPQNEFAAPTFLEMNAASGRGVVVGVEHANVNWPIELQSGGDGRIEVALLPFKDPADTFNYGITYASAETRCFWVIAEGAPAADPIVDAQHFELPLGARAEPWVYNQSNVWHWRLVAKTDVDNYIAHAGIRTPAPSSTDLVRTVYEYSNTTGAGSNNWEETRRFYQWLRSGLGGAALNSWFEALYKVDRMAWSIDDDILTNRQKVRNTTAPVTKKDDFYNNSKHTFLQVVADWGFTHGETYMLDSARSFTETILDTVISPNVQPDGNFVCGTYGSIVNAAVAVLDMRPDATLETFVHDICFQWSNVVFQVSNSFGVNTSTLGWQAPIGTTPGTSANPDGYMISWAAGKSSDKAQYGYTTQAWTDVRLGALAYERYVHHLLEVSPGDSLINDLASRAADWYHYSRRSIPDDFQMLTGDAYIIDVFEGDAGNPNVYPFTDPGDDLDFPDPSGYALMNIVSFLLAGGISESALSYGVELHRSLSKGNYDDMINDPVLNEFIWRYLVHYGLLKP